MTQAWDKEKTDSPTGIEPRRQTKSSRVVISEIKMVNFEFLCPALVPCWSIHLSHLIAELKIHHIYSLITTHDDFDSADPSSMQDACHKWSHMNSVKMTLLSMNSRSSVDRARSRCSGDHGLDSCRSHTCTMLINSPFTFHYGAQNPPSFFTYLPRVKITIKQVLLQNNVSFPSISDLAKYSVIT